MHRLGPGTFLLALALPALARMPEAQAEDRPTARLHYESAEGARCPDEQGFRDIVAGRLGYDPFTTDAESEVDARIRQEGAAFSARVSVRDAAGSELGARELSAATDDCSEIATAMAIAISIMLDPLGVAQASEPPTEAQSPAPSPESPARAEPPPAPPAVATAPESTGRDLTLIARASLAIEGRLAPGLTLGPLLSVGLGFDRFAVLLDGRVRLMPSATTIDSGDRVDAALYSVGPSACVSFGVGLGCLGVELGVFQGRGVEVVDPRTQSSLFAAAHARLGVSVPLGKVLSFHALGELVAPLVRTSLSIEGKAVWNAPAIGGGGLLGFGATFL